jgi:DNA (cytosine-5)-methyltransferase 1
MNFIEVCAGCGGLSTGLISAGFTPLLLIDNDKQCCETLKLNHTDVNVVCQSFTEYNFEEYQHKVDLFVGGVPCQSFSQAGLRKGLDDNRGDLLLKFIDLINIIKPKVFMIENVKGLITHNKGETFAEILSKINKDYIVSFKCINAADYEIPQKRERVFVVGTITGEFTFPEVSKNAITLENVLLDVPQSIGATYPEKKITLFKMIPEGGCWINLPEDIQKEYLGKSYESGGGKHGILRRLAMNKPSLTLLCSPSQKQTERCHPLEERPLTIREYARIQTFDDDYKFTGSMSSQYKQIGNAVPVKLAKVMGEQLMKLLNEINII